MNSCLVETLHFFFYLIFTYCDIAFIFLFICFSPIGILYLDYDEWAPKLFRIKTIPPPTFQFMPLWSDDMKARLFDAEADFGEHGVTDPRAQFLPVTRALPRDFNRCVTPNKLTSGVSEFYETLKNAILKRGNLTERQMLDQPFHNIELQRNSATYMPLRIREVIDQRTLKILTTD